MSSSPDRRISLASLARSTAILAGGTAAAQVIGIIRELFVAAQVGISGQYDAVLIALVLPMTIGAVLTSGVTTALVPAYVAIGHTGGREQANRLAGATMTWIGIAALLLSLVLIPLAGVLVYIVGPGLSPVGHNAAVSYLMVLAPIVFVTAISGILYAVCQAEERFGTIARSTFAGPAAALLVTLASWDRMGLDGLVLASLVGPTVSAVILGVGTIRAKIAPWPHLQARGLGMRALLRHAAPLTVGAAIMQLTTIADRAIASLIAPGAVSALRYAEVLVRLPIGAIGPAWGNAVYPALVRSSSGLGRDGLASLTTTLLRVSIALFVPIAALTAAVAPVAVGVAYGRGAFTQEALALTAKTVAAFAPLIALLMINPIFVDSLNARRRGTVLLVGSVVSVILNFVLDLALGLTLGVPGIALSTSITIATVMILILGRSLTRAESDLHLGPLGRRTLVTMMAIAPAMALFGILAWTGSAPHEGIQGWIFLAVAGVVGLGSYGVIAARLGLEEPLILFKWIKGRLRRGRVSVESAP